MRVPIWLTLAVAALVIVFGLYRVALAFRRAEPDAAARPGRFGLGGMYRMGRRTHALVGIIYLLLGASLVATSFGWNPFAGAFGPSTQPPTKGTTPTKGGVPIDTVGSPPKHT
jgi:hypothetical protein